MTFRAVTFVLVAALFCIAPTGAAWGARYIPAAEGTTYYVDTSRGDDEARGTAPGQLWPKGSGIEAHPIVIDRYGEGPRPAVHGAGQVADAVRLHNQQHWEIRNLEVTNEVPLGDGEPGANLRATMPAIGSLAYYANSSNYGKAYVDNVSVAYGRPAV